MQKDLADFVKGEFKEGRKIDIEEVSYHTQYDLLMFSHRKVEGQLFLDEVSGENLIVVPNVTQVVNLSDAEDILRAVRRTGAVYLKSAEHYIPGQSVSLYSGDWTFHCRLNGQSKKLN